MYFRYVIFYTPFDIGYKAAKFLPIKIVCSAMKEIYRQVHQLEVKEIQMLLLLCTFVFTQLPMCRLVPLKVAPQHSSIGDAEHMLPPQPKITGQASGHSCTQGCMYVVTVVCICAYDLITDFMVRSYFYLHHSVLDM